MLCDRGGGEGGRTPEDRVSINFTSGRVSQTRNFNLLSFFGVVFP